MDSSDVDAVRKAGVSRRGGVRTRGGRLPPIRIGNVTIASNNKKTIVPNIPQRRVKVKEEIVESSSDPQKFEAKENQRRDRGRGRGKVFLQTGGSLLGEGPALKPKKELKVPLCEKAAYASSKPRSKTDSLMKIDSGVIDELLKSYDDTEEFHDSTFKPMQLPYVKLEEKFGYSKINIKKEKMDPDYNFEEVKMRIKQEVIEPTETKISIKCEPLDDYELNAPIKDSEFKSDIDLKTDLKDFKVFLEERSLILLQLPSHLPFAKIKNTYKKEQSEKKNSETPDGNETTGVSIKNLSEGYIGKMQFMKSGKIRILIGSSVFFVEEGVDPKSLWEVASITAEEKSKGSVIALGKIKAMASLRPCLL